MIVNFLKSLVNKTQKVAEKVRKDGWQNILTGLGQQGRDKTASTCFRACAYFSPTELDELYRADGLTRRIIDIVPAEMMRQGWELEGDSKDIIAGQLDELNAYTKITSLIQYSRLYGGAIIVMGINDGRPLDQPVNLDAIKSVDWLHVFDRWQVQIMFDFICCDLNDPNYGCPQIYQVNDYRTGAVFNVHESRILRMDWSILPPRQQFVNAGWADSLIVSIWDELKNYGAAFANTSAIMQDFVNGVMKIPGLSNDMSSSCAEVEAALTKRLNWANIGKSTVGMLVVDGEEDYQKLSTNVSGLDGLIDRFMLALCAVTGIPSTLLFGRSAGGLNATGDNDVRNFYDMIKQLQETKLKPILERLTLYLMRAQLGPFAGKEADNWNIRFVPLWQNTEEQEALIHKLYAETDSMYIDRGVLQPDEVAISRFGGDRWSSITNIDILARENGFDPNEIEKLTAEKEAEEATMTPAATIGPSDTNGRSNILFVD